MFIFALFFAAISWAMTRGTLDGFVIIGKLLVIPFGLAYIYFLAWIVHLLTGLTGAPVMMIALFLALKICDLLTKVLQSRDEKRQTNNSQ